MVVAVHLEEEVLVVAVVGNLVAEDLDRVLLPLVEVTRRDPDVSQPLHTSHYANLHAALPDTVAQAPGRRRAGAGG